MVAFEVASEEDEIVICTFACRDGGAPFKTAAKAEIRLITDDRLDPGVGHRVKKRDRPVHIAVVGHGTRFLAQLF